MRAVSIVLLMPLALLVCSRIPRYVGERDIDGSGGISVVVVDQTDGRRLSLRSVHVVRTDGSKSPIWAGPTTALPAGSYTVRVNVKGYDPDTKICVVTPGMTTEIVFYLTKVPGEDPDPFDW